jgi:XTP/dITP diphosphohydrolase
MKICAATGNAGKLRELRRILEAQGHEVVSQKELGITIEPDETGTTFAENALIKAETICKVSGLPTIADDSGLCVDALGGAPGVYSARYCGHHGDDEANNDKLLDAMKEVPEGKRGAKFVSAVCFILPDGRHLTCMGECPGSIAFERLNGDYGFGYDPLFIPADCGVGKRDKRPNTEHRSYAQLTPDEKDAISHRGNALAVLEKQLPEFLGAAKEEGIIAQVSGTVEIELK